MEPIYSYLTIKESSEGSYHESGSKFLGFARRVDHKDDVEEVLSMIKALHPKARHHCYAYRFVDRDEITEFATDAGEPSGSAGQPILGELRRNNLMNLCVIVVRYFGGTKLGIPGLIHAYRESTRFSIEAAETIMIRRAVTFFVDMPIALQPKFYSACKQCGFEVEEPEYHERFAAHIQVPREHTESHVQHLLALIAGQDGETDQLCDWLGIRLQEIED